MTAASLAVLALVSLATMVVLLRSIGPRFRIGRLLAATPEASIAEAIALARAGEPAYVRVTGRVSSDEEFPDEHDRPLVFRRTRIDLAASSRSARRSWTTHVDEREAVPFGVESRTDFIAVDETALADGLVVIPREAIGVAADLPADLAEGLPRNHEPSAPARLVIEQLSAVEHATICGSPVVRNGVPSLTAGLGRPLVVTTLEPAAAMRLLARNHRGRVVVSFGLLVAGVALGLASIIAALIGI